jgi:hypothetical protein
LNINTSRSGWTEEELQNFTERYKGPQTDPEWECAICAEGGDEVVWLPCVDDDNQARRHGFHKHCITQWFQVSRVCPLCRAEVSDDVMQGRRGSQRASQRASQR